MINKQEILHLKLLSEGDFIKIRNGYRVLGKKLVFTNGCFDILHRGHIDYLAKAASLGDYLIVAINSDASVRKLKGANRPITDQQSRAEIMAALFFVDAVIIFDDETPLRLINLIKPDILAKGADYTIETIVGAKEVIDNGGKVETIEFLDGYSTTLIENKIKSGN